MSDADSAFGADSYDVPAISQTGIMVDPALVGETADESATGDDDDAAPAQDGEIRYVSKEVLAPIPEADAAEEESAELQAASLADLVSETGHAGALDAEMECLAGTVYFESKGEPLEGQLAVAEVVLARAESRRWPNSICGVVYQRSQFSFVRGGRMPAINKSSRAWKRAVAIARIAQDDSWDSPVDGALFFHATYVRPGWKLRRIGQVSNHIFYR